MTVEPLLKQEQPRDLDPNVRQRRASFPQASVWVSASAGSGKTKVLTDRVLRLLLPHADGAGGAAPHRILCLTFTKAAASEMALRLGKTLGKWAVMPQQDLIEDLHRLTGAAPTPLQLAEARKLFAAVSDAPDGLKIMTIHAFCQSVLSRFPLEAELPPGFTVLEEAQARELLTSARDAVLEQARKDPSSRQGQMLAQLVAELNEEQFGHLLQSLSGERRQLAASATLPDLHAALCDALSAPAENEDALLAAACENASFDYGGLLACCRALADGSEKTDQPKGLKLQRFLEASPAGRAAMFDDYLALFLTTEGEARKDQMTKKLAAQFPDEAAILSRECARLLDICEKIRAVRCAALSHALFTLGHDIARAYQTLKDRRAALDFDDLIIRTRALLANRADAAWVMYKLDGGLDHILIDEAQDTNPEQWEIIDSLTADFFTGAGAQEDNVTRTVFTVGDEKQSIYSFQRAAPREFARMRAHFARKIEAARQEWRDEPMNISFRSSRTVLRLVDKTFGDPAVRQGLGDAAPVHHTHRRGQAGLCELWPVFEPDDRAAEAPWTPPVAITEQRSGAARLAEHIGSTVAGWIGKEFLPSRNRTVQAGDIMILVCTRTAFVGQLVRALKTRGVPVSGIDRMVLGEQIAVMDLLAAAQVALLPADDLSLACLLKSPFIGWSDENLYDFCQPRRGTLWDETMARAESPVKAWLQNLRTAAHAAPFEFFSMLLHTPCPADKASGLRALRARLGDDALDPLDEFLNATLDFERGNIPALQNFIAWQQREDMMIKREQEEAGSCVRIMTVHGAKGLQAPIVILPDTLRAAAPHRTPRLLWPDKSGAALPLWSPRKDSDCAAFKAAQNSVQAQMDEEYRRLLYVAMTRAEDRLYVGGYKGRRAPQAESWYYYIRRAFESFSDAETIETQGQVILRLTDPQQSPHDAREKDAEDGRDYSGTALPDWLYAPPPEEPRPTRPLIPSRAESAPGPAALSPLAASAQNRFRRGVITHKLLQFLPALPPEKRRTAAVSFVEKPSHGLTADIRKDIIDETFAILEHPDFAPLFGPGALAEVPIAGLAGNRIVSGQIDRLLITDKEILIVDYKTGRPPPQDPKEVPQAYRDQLAAYRTVLAQIYPGRPVRTFLLWTDGPRLAEVSDKLPRISGAWACF